LAKVIDWASMSNPEGDAAFADIAAFIRDNPDWPDQAGLRREAESRMPDDLPPAEVVAWFEAYPAVGIDGVMRYAGALEALERTGEAAELIRRQWPDIGLSTQGQQDMLSAFGGHLGEADHAVRLDTLLWEGRTEEARRMLPLVGPGWRALGEARLRLADRASGVDALVDAVPPELAGDEGLIYERVRWRRRAGFTGSAVDLLEAEQPEALDHPDAWWTERHILARRLFEAGDHARAYRVASGHRQPDGFPRSQAEWLSGWLALSFLDDPEAAFRHFQALYHSVGSPISLARGAYWSGRALEATGRTEEAERWYRLAAEHPSAFYGQLAAGRLGLPTVPPLPADPAAPPDRAAAFETGELARVTEALDAVGEDARADLFLRQLARNAETPAETVLVGRLAEALDRPHMAVWAAKQLVYDAVVLYETGYPVRVLDTAAAGVEPALLHALMRRESEFNSGAVSPAGALGLMQLMPATADTVAARLGVDHNARRLTAEPDYNIRLGSAYLAEMLERYRGSYVLAVAAYNAGPGRVDDWLEERGDPRAAGVDVIDWIEGIPIYETRNYVQRVLEDTQVYRQRLGGSPTVGALEADLAR
jgi:soluble lytic murein transglycosylase